MGPIIIGHFSDPIPGGDIVDLWVCPEAFQEPERMGALGELRDLVFGLIEISESNGLGRADLGACRNVFMFFKLSSAFCIGLVFGPHEAMVAEGAFFHHPPHARRDFRGKGAFHALGKWLDEGIAVPAVEISGLQCWGQCTSCHLNL